MAVSGNGSTWCSADAAMGNIAPQESAATSEGRESRGLVRCSSNIIHRGYHVVRWESNMHGDEPRIEDMNLATVMAALSDPMRVAIVRALAAEGERPCGTFDLGISKATRSHHFKVLREAGLTHTRAEGPHRHISLRREDVDARFPGLLGAVLSAAEREAGDHRG